MAFLYYNNILPDPDTTANKALSGWNVMSKSLAAVVENILQYAPLVMNVGPESSVALNVDDSVNTSFKVTAGRVNTPIGPVQFVEDSLSLGDANEHMAVLVFGITWTFNKNVDFQSVEGVNIPIDEFDEIKIDGVETVIVATNGNASRGTNDVGYYNPADGDLLIDQLGNWASNRTFTCIAKGSKTFWTNGSYLSQSTYENNQLLFAFPLGFLKAESTTSPAEILDSSQYAPDIQPFVAGGSGGVSSWNDLTDKPSSYPSTWEQVSGKPSSYPSSWDNVSGKPAAYPTNWANISNPPDKYKPTDHSHFLESSFSIPANQASYTVTQVGVLDQAKDKVTVFFDRQTAEGDTHGADEQFAQIVMGKPEITINSSGQLVITFTGRTPTIPVRMAIRYYKYQVQLSDPTPTTQSVQTNSLETENEEGTPDEVLE